MTLWKCSFCEGSSKSNEQRKKHEVVCFENPKNKNMTLSHLKKRMELNKKQGSKK